MAETVDKAHVHAYSAEVIRLVTEGEYGSKTRPFVRLKTGVTGKSANFERLGRSTLPIISGRHSQTQILNPEHTRRRATFTDRGGAILLDRHDEIKMLIQPKNDYARNHAESYNEVLDETVLAALTGSATAVDENDATSSVAIGATQQIAAGAVGLTFEKVNQANRILNEGPVPLPRRAFAISPQGMEDLLGETEVTSSDFSQLMALREGRFTGPYMGFTWIMTTLLTKVSTTRTCIAWQADGIGLAIGMDLDVKISERPDLNHAWQVWAGMSLGAVRVEEVRVVQVDITES